MTWRRSARVLSYMWFAFVAFMVVAVIGGSRDGVDRIITSTWALQAVSNACFACYFHHLGREP